MKEQFILKNNFYFNIIEFSGKKGPIKIITVSYTTTFEYYKDHILKYPFFFDLIGQLPELQCV